jgi:hypothetical protein
MLGDPMKKTIYLFSLISILLVCGCLFDNDDNNDSSKNKENLNASFVGDWLFTYKTSREQELWQWAFNADGSMNSCRWETSADGSLSSSHLCVEGSWSDVGDVATLWPELYPALEQYPEVPFSKGHAILTPIDTSKSNLRRWSQGWLLYARNDTLTYLGTIATLYGGPQLYGDPWTYQDKTFIFYEDGTCSMLNNDSSNCSWGIRETEVLKISDVLEISWDAGNGEKDYLDGHFAIHEGKILLLDLEDSADFFRQ